MQFNILCDNIGGRHKALVHVESSESVTLSVVSSVLLPHGL